MIKKRKTERILLLIIFLLGSFLRFYKLDQYPAGFTPDEAAQGYTAYSILKTGRDEWGVKFPLSLRSFGDFKPPLQTYLMIPSIVILGLNETAVRLPNALLSSLAIIGVFLLAKEFFQKTNLGLLAASLLAFSPWHLPLSRGAFEANLAVFFFSFGLYFFLKNKQILAALFLGLNMFSYHSAKLITPLIVFVFLFLYENYKYANYKETLKKQFRFLALFSIFFFFAFASFFSGGQKRGMDIAVFNPTDKWQAVADERWWANQQGLPDFMARVFHNKLSYSLSVLAKNYFSYFSLQFVFAEGPAEGTYGMMPGRGVLWWWELPIVLFALCRLIKKPEKKVLLLTMLILIAPLPAALAKGVRAANRAAVMMPFLQLLVAWGISQIQLKKIRKGFFFAFLLMVLGFFSFFLEDYFVQSPRKTAQEMLYGRCQALRWVAENLSGADRIVVSRKLSEPQAYAMFCLQYPPWLAQNETAAWLEYQTRGLGFVDQLGEYYLGKFIFREINWASDSKIENAVLIGRPQEFPEKNSFYEVKYPNGEKAVLVFKTEKTTKDVLAF